MLDRGLANLHEKGCLPEALDRTQSAGHSTAAKLGHRARQGAGSCCKHVALPWAQLLLGMQPG